MTPRPPEARLPPLSRKKGRPTRGIARERREGGGREGRCEAGDPVRVRVHRRTRSGRSAGSERASCTYLGRARYALSFCSVAADTWPVRTAHRVRALSPPSFTFWKTGARPLCYEQSDDRRSAARLKTRWRISAREGKTAPARRRIHEVYIALHCFFFHAKRNF